MKMLKNKLLLLAVAGFVAVYGCARQEQYGKAITEDKFIPLSDVLGNMNSYSGKTVKVQGKIVTECPTGCWFEMAEGPAVLYVDIGPQGLAIPQKVGKKVVVEGRIVVEGYKAKLLGGGLVIQ